MRNKFLWISIFVAMALVGSLSFFLSRNKDGVLYDTATNTTQTYESCVKNFSVELCGMHSTEGRARLYQTCFNLAVPKSEKDTTLYADNKLVVARWRDNLNQQDVTTYLPYEPETGFNGCSVEARELLQGIKRDHEKFIAESCADFRAIISGEKPLPEKGGQRANIQGAIDFVKQYCK